MMIRWLCIYAVIGAVELASGQFWNRTRRQNGPSCFTPDQIQGTCLNIRQCPPLLELLQKSRSKPGVVEFLRRCNPEVTSEVCCPPQNDFRRFMSPPECGKTFVNQQPRVVGGTPAELGAWPWIAILGYRTSKKPGPMWNCGGALVSQRHVITAAHCVVNTGAQKLFVVRLGESELGNDNDGASPVDIFVQNFVAHPSYSPSTKQDDIAVVRLERDAPFTRHIQPICLPKLPELMSQKFVKYYPFVAGWGTTSRGGESSSKLLQVQVPVTDNESCDKAYSPKGARIASRQLCAGYLSGGKDACQGDSGGPLMLPQGNVYYLIGVVSYGYGCAMPGFPGVYTRITSYLDWLSTTMT